MTTKEIILSIADGTLSVSRIRRIAKAIYGVDLSPTEIVSVTSAANIATPHRIPSENRLLNAYPDQWSILLEAQSFWVRVRRIWGDVAAATLKEKITVANAGEWRSLSDQFGRYIDPQIYERRNINFGRAEVNAPAPLEEFYPWGLQRDLYLQAYDQELQARPQSQTGAQFPLPSNEFETFRKDKFKKDCLELFDKTLGNEQAVIQYFAEFWRTVYDTRGEVYYESLTRDFVGRPDQSLYQKPFYSATEGNFRHFLHNLNGFKTKGPWRVVLLHDPSRPLPMALEGALLKYGWQKVQSMAAIGSMI